MGKTSRDAAMENLACGPHLWLDARAKRLQFFHPKKNMMTPELRDLIARSPYTQATVREVAALLPEEDAALDALLAEMVSRCEDTEFVMTVQAALHAGRAVQARHLGRGAMLLPDRWLLGAFACHVQGDVAGALLEAVTGSKLPFELVPSAIYLAAHFQVEQREGRLPGTLLSHARTAARTVAAWEGEHVYEKGMLYAVALLCGDPGLISLLHESEKCKGPEDPRIQHWEEGSKRLAEQMMVNWRRPPLDLVPATERRALAEGNTMRRAVARTGRNEKCPCGSGKKYKQCCMEKDAETLRHSTSIAGVTEMELRANPERYLTAVELDSTTPIEAARFDPMKIEKTLRMNYLACLCRGALYERCVEAMEALGYSEELEEAWDNISIRIAQARRKDLVDRMMALRPDAAEQRVGALTMFLAEDDPAKMVETLRQASWFFLQDDPKPSQLYNFAETLMKSPLCGLGIMVARGMLPTLPRETATALLRELLEARDRLSLKPEDPISDVMDHLFLEQRSGNGKEAAVLREVQQRLNDKLQETRRYRENVDRLEKELARREQLAATRDPQSADGQTQQSAAQPEPSPAAADAPATAVDEPALRELRHKVDELKSALKERHNERNALRRELHEAHEALDALRQKAVAAPAAHEEADHEEDLLLPQEKEGNHPVRTIDFPKDFRERLASLPKSVARGTMTMLGRLAAGEPSAFVGAVRLKACPDITRQRIGIDFRLLVRLLPDRVQVVDLIPRQDLERRIKTLA
jgi:hypothetical protein